MHRAVIPESCVARDRSALVHWRSEVVWEGDDCYLHSGSILGHTRGTSATRVIYVALIDCFNPVCSDRV